MVNKTIEVSVSFEGERYGVYCKPEELRATRDFKNNGIKKGELIAIIFRVVSFSDATGADVSLPIEHKERVISMAKQKCRELISKSINL